MRCIAVCQDELVDCPAPPDAREVAAFAGRCPAFAACAARCSGIAPPACWNCCAGLMDLECLPCMQRLVACAMRHHCAGSAAPDAACVAARCPAELLDCLGR
jgi:hypothetical protein